MKNTFALQLQDDNVVISHQVEEYFKQFLSDYVTNQPTATLLSVDVQDSLIWVRYIVQGEDCADCNEDGNLGECPHEWFETINYKHVDVYGG